MVQRLWLCLIPIYHSWLIPSVAGNHPKKRPRVDPQWSEAIERLEIDYDLKGTSPPSLVTAEFSPRDSWDLIGHYEIPYYAMLYTNITVEGIQDPHTGFVPVRTFTASKPEGACGGILFKQDQVLTTCGCLYNWWRWLTYNDQTDAERAAFNANMKIFQYTMNSKFLSHDDQTNPYVPTIYLSHSLVYFNPDFSHKIINNIRKQKSDFFTCNYYRNHGFQAEEMIYALTLANFEPAIQDLDLSSYIPWPPVPIANITHYNRLQPVAADSEPIYPDTGIRARVVGIGFQGEGVFTDDLGETIAEENSMIDAETEVRPIEECRSKFNNLVKLQAYVQFYVVCLKGVIRGDGRGSVRDAFPGNPVLTGFGSLAGMVVESASFGVNSHYYIMINFIGQIQYLFEMEQASYLLERMKVVRAPLYREGGWERIFMQYSVPPLYDEDDTEPTFPEYDERRFAAYGQLDYGVSSSSGAIVAASIPISMLFNVDILVVVVVFQVLSGDGATFELLQ